MIMGKYNNPNDYWKYDPEYRSSSKGYKGCVFSLFGILVVIVIALMLTSCRSVRYIPVETVRTEYVHKTDTFLSKDSVMLHDSVFIHSKGDTVWYERWHTKYKDRVVTKIVTDSFIKRDTVQVPYPVEKKVSRWESLKTGAVGFSVAVGMILLLLFSYLFFIKFKT